MSSISPLDAGFLKTLECWLEYQAEILVVIRYSRAAGSRSFEFFRSIAALSVRLGQLPAQTSIARHGHSPTAGRLQDFLLDSSKLLQDLRRRQYSGAFMRVLREGMLVTILVAQLSTSALIGWTQASQSLQGRIAKPDPKKYHSVQAGKNWQNPFLIVRRDGIQIVRMEIAGKPAAEQTIPIDSVPGVLKSLPDSAWPYGLVVAVVSNGVVSVGDPPRITANRKRLLMLLKKLGIAVDLWPSA